MSTPCTLWHAAPMLCHLLAKRLNSNLPFLKLIRVRAKDNNSLTSSTNRKKTNLYSLATLANSSEGFFVSCLFLLKINYHAIFDKAIQNRLCVQTSDPRNRKFFKMLCSVIAQAELLAMLAAIGPSHFIWNVWVIETNYFQIEYFTDLEFNAHREVRHADCHMF